MKRRSFVVLSGIVFLSCASGAPREYRDGMPLRPPPAPGLRPGVGAPAIGQPGFEPRDYPKSPYTRVLPEDEKTRKEDTIWAASQKKSDSPILFPDLLASFLPENANLYDEFTRNNCVVLLAFTYVAAESENPGVLIQNEKIYSEEQRRCMISMIYHACIQGMWERNRDERKASIKAGKLPLESLDNLLSRAAEIKRKECDQISLPDKAEKSVRIKIRRIRNYKAAQ